MKNIFGLIGASVSCVLLAVLSSCSNEQRYLRYALKVAGENRPQLERVLDHYRHEDKDPSKLAAAKYLIINMPGHFSYTDTATVDFYYNAALKIQQAGGTPEWQRDTLRSISDALNYSLSRAVESDIKLVTSDYLIDNIDKAFHEWRTRPWAQHLTFDEFRDWILPYKVIDYQLLDSWRDTLSARFSDSISSVPSDDDRRLSIYGAIDIVRNEIHTKNPPRVLWEERSGIPLRSAQTWANMTFGSCYDYVTMGTAVFRSLGLPSVVDRVPVWGRNSEGHSWFTFLSDQGKETPTINSLIVAAGMPFYPYERIPKVWRNTFAINRDIVRYRNTAKYVHQFDLCEHDVTDHYVRTSDIEVQLMSDIRIDDKYAYIAVFVNSGGPSWRVLDYGEVKHGKACFRNMGRNVLYIALYYNGSVLAPASEPFILQKDGRVRYIHSEGGDGVRSIDIRRKYFESYNVVDMRRRILGGKIQCATRPDFSDSVTLYTIETTKIPDKIPVCARAPYRYWRYLSPNGSWGSVAEVLFMDSLGNPVKGRGIAVPEAGQDAIDRAYDGNLLSNFEVNQPDGNWVGLDLGTPGDVSFVRIVPRSDDNDICPGNQYELMFFDGLDWFSIGRKVADDNTLHYENVPINKLLWLRNYTRGNDERPFLLDQDGNIEWW